MKMDATQQVTALWKAIDEQRWRDLPGFFHPEARIDWPNTKESFTVDEFVKANSYYPGSWSIELCRLEQWGRIAVSAVRVSMGQLSFHACSFFTFRGGVISELTEYWGEDGPPPAWRRELGLGSLILSPEEKG